MFWRQSLVYPFTVLCCELQSEYPCVLEFMNLGVQYFSLVSLPFQYHTFSVTSQ